MEWALAVTIESKFVGVNQLIINVNVDLKI